MFTQVIEKQGKMGILLGNINDMRRSNLTWKAGDKYGFLTLTGKAFRNSKSRIEVECVCALCGRVEFKRLSGVVSGHIQSCRCKKRPHGMAHTRQSLGHPLYSAWMNMKNRCYQKSHRSFKTYSGKSITVCQEWLNNFKTFFEWAINNGWEEGLTLDRRENSLGYSPDNCWWRTNPQQQRNKDNNINLTAFGETKCLTDWVGDGRCTVSFHTIKYRLDILEWGAERAISHPNMNPTGQRENRRNSIMAEYNGEEKTLAEWCEIKNLKYPTIRNRIYKGWDIKEALETEINLNKVTNKN